MYTRQQQLNHNKKPKISTFGKSPPKNRKCKECLKMFKLNEDNKFKICCSSKCEIDYASKSVNINKLIEDGRKARVKEANKKKKEFNENENNTTKK